MSNHFRYSIIEVILQYSSKNWVENKCSLTLSLPGVKKTCKIERIAISKLVLSIIMMCERIRVYLCVVLSVCNVLVFRILLLHL